LDRLPSNCGFSYIPVAIATSYIATLRSIQFVKITVIATATALIFKTILVYVLIFGYLGFPALGVEGAAIGTASGWTLELLLLLFFVYAGKTPLASNPCHFFSFDFAFLNLVLKTTLPGPCQRIFLVHGITTYNAIYARIGTDAIAAINVMPRSRNWVLWFSWAGERLCGHGRESHRRGQEGRGV